MKSKGTAYLLWFFLGALGAHKFYLGKVGTGGLYLFTLGLFGIGLLIDLFTLGSQVDNYNAMFMARSAMMGVGAVQSQNQQVVVNVTAPMPPSTPSLSSEANEPKSIEEGQS